MAKTTELQAIGNKDPKNLEAEINTLGCAIISKTALDKVTNQMTRDMFFDNRNKMLFDAILDIQKNNLEIDNVTLVNALQKKVNSLEEVGGPEYIADVVRSVASASNIDSYIDIVKDKYIRRSVIKTCENIENIARSEEMSTTDTIDLVEKQIASVTRQRKAGEFKTAAEVVNESLKLLEELSKKGNDVTGIATGFADFDKLTGGLQPHQLIIIAARPAMGKTAFALNLAVNAALSSGKGVVLFNLEMGASQLMSRMFAAEGAIEASKLRTGQLNHDDWKRVNEAASVLKDAPIYFEDATNITISEIRAKCRRVAEQTGNLGLVIIDYLQLITGGPGYGSNRQQEVSDISRSLKTMAMELNIPVIALAQLSRNVESREDKRPMLSDLRESGSIEQDADIVSFLYRADYYNNKGQEQSPISESKLIVAKHRNGSTKDIDLIFERNISKFRNYDKIHSNNEEN